MKIAGFQKTSFVDYPGKMAAVVFTPGCNMDCYYCHNRVILGADADRTFTSVDEVMEVLTRRRNVLDGLVITGGEPTLQKGLRPFIEAVKELDYPVKLDTNGTRPEILMELVDARLVDFVAMDVKAPWQRYEEICGVEVDLEAVERSIALLLEGKVHHEFRTTFSPELTDKDVVRLASGLQGAQRFVLQQYRAPTLAPPGDLRAAAAPHSSDYLRATAVQVRNLSIPCDVRGI